MFLVFLNTNFLNKLHIHIFILLYKKSKSIQLFHIWNVSFNIIISRTSAYYKDLQKIKLENLKNIITGLPLFESKIFPE